MFRMWDGRSVMIMMPSCTKCKISVDLALPDAAQIITTGEIKPGFIPMTMSWNITGQLTVSTTRKNNCIGGFHCRFRRVFGVYSQQNRLSTRQESSHGNEFHQLGSKRKQCSIMATRLPTRRCRRQCKTDLPCR